MSSKATAEQKGRRDVYNKRCRRDNEIELSYYSKSSISFASGKRGFFVSPADASLMRRWLVAKL